MQAERITQKEDIVKRYFQSRLDKNIEPLKDIFADDIIYSECYEPKYHGLPQILKWFSDWNTSRKPKGADAG